MKLSSLRTASVLAQTALLLSPAVASAVDFQPMYRSPHYAAMGGAYVALVEEDDALYLNPAGLAASKDLKLKYMVVDTELSSSVLTDGPAIATALQSFSGSSIDAILGKNAFFKATATPTLVGPNLAFGYLYDGQVALRSENAAYPQINVGYRTTQGGQVGWGTTIGGVGRPSRRKALLRFGVAAKMLSRRGGYRNIPISTLLTASTDAVKDIFGDAKIGYGVDAGLQGLWRVSKRFSLLGGVSMTDIGHTSFGDGPDLIPMNLSYGIAGRTELSFARLTVAYDYQNALTDADWRRKNHLGAELALPLLSLYAGLNQVYMTYGAAFDLWVFRVSGAIYTEEQGGLIRQSPERRFALRLGLNFGF